MSALLGVLGLLSVLVGIFVLIVRFFKKKSKKMPLILMLVGFISFVIGVSINTDKVEKADENKPVIESTENNDMASESTEKPVSKKKEEKKKTSKKKEKEVFNFGEPVLVGKVEYTVNSVDSSENIGGEYGQNAQGVFLIVNVTVVNKGNEPLSVSNNFFKLINEEKEYNSDSTAGIYANESGQSFFINEINPDNSLSSNVVFDVSQDTAESGNKRLQVQTGVWGTETSLINLQ